MRRRRSVLAWRVRTKPRAAPTRPVSQAHRVPIAARSRRLATPSGLRQRFWRKAKPGWVDYFIRDDVRYSQMRKHLGMKVLSQGAGYGVIQVQ